MSSGPFERVRRLYGRADALVSELDNLDGVSCSYMSTISNIVERLPAMNQSENYGQLQQIEGYVHLVQSRQLQALEDAMRRLKETTASMVGKVREFEKLVVETNRLVSTELGAGGPDMMIRRFGPQPSPSECMEGMQAVWGMYRDEVALRAAAVQEIHYDMKPEEMAALVALFSERPCIEISTVRNLLRRVLDSATSSAAI